MNLVNNKSKLTNITEEDWQEDETMSGSKHHHSEIHAEVKHLEELGLREGQNADAHQLCKGNAT